MNKKKGLILTSLAAILGCGLLGTGATYALFTSEATNNIAITAGKVDVTAEITEFKMYSVTACEQTDEGSFYFDDEGNGGKFKSYYKYVEQDSTFINGGTATQTVNNINLDKMTPGDKVTFDIVITNNSNVSTKEKITTSITDDTGLFAGLNITIDGETYLGLEDGKPWEEIVGTKTKSVVIEMPMKSGNEFADKTFAMKFAVLAVQANAYTPVLPEGADYVLNTAEDMMLYSAYANAGKLNNKKVVLNADVNMTGKTWTPIDGSGKGLSFDGQGHVIKNLNVIEGLHDSGFFSTGSGCKVENVVFDGAKVKGIGRVAVAVGHGMCAIVDKVTVKNSSVEAVVTDNDDGDKAALVVGYLSGEPVAKVTNCIVLDSEVKGYRDVGSVVGYAGGTYTVTDNQVDGVQIINDRTVDYKHYETDAEYDVHEIIGEQGANGTVSGNTFENVTFTTIIPVKATEVQGKLNQAKDGDIFSIAKEEEPIKMPSTNGKAVVIEGNGNKVDDSSTVVTSGDASIAQIDNATIKDMVFDLGTSSNHGFTHSSATFENCTFNGVLFTYTGSGDGCQTFINCTFNLNKNEYPVYAYDEAKFIGCTFNNPGGKGAKIFNHGPNGSYNVYFEDCEFFTEENAGNKPAIALATYGISHEVTIINCTAHNFAVAKDDAMDDWYASRMPDTVDSSIRSLFGAELLDKTLSFDLIAVTIDGTSY